MLFLLFQLGNDRYVLDASRVVEVLPLLELKKIPHAPKGVAGLFNYRGRPVPAVDLSELAVDQPARERLSTRIIVVKYSDHAGKNLLLGLIAERATEMLRRDSKDFVDSGVQLGAAPYLGPVLMDGQGVIQWVHEQRLLSEKVRDLLFSETISPAAAAPLPT
ncbi:MAG: purine-binding chemotaxis protein CheW [Verrucomicrobia bacterium]|nr:purine-binding chemotaxis protein CheW [Verrucomicrobiota bacterium]